MTFALTVGVEEIISVESDEFKADEWILGNEEKLYNAALIDKEIVNWMRSIMKLTVIQLVNKTVDIQRLTVQHKNT